MIIHLNFLNRFCSAVVKDMSPIARLQRVVSSFSHFFSCAIHAKFLFSLNIMSLIYKIEMMMVLVFVYFIVLSVDSISKPAHAEILAL